MLYGGSDLTVQDAHSHLLSVNFGKQLAEAFEEGRLWSSLGYSVSKTIAQLQADAERLRLLRWSVEGLINQHNQVKAVSMVSDNILQLQDCMKGLAKQLINLPVAEVPRPSNGLLKLCSWRMPYKRQL